jgi:hypothetical protein
MLILIIILVLVLGGGGGYYGHTGLQLENHLGGGGNDALEFLLPDPCLVPL